MKHLFLYFLDHKDIDPKDYSEKELMDVYKDWITNESEEYMQGIRDGETDCMTLAKNDAENRD